MARFYKVLRKGNENSTVKGFLGMLEPQQLLRKHQSHEQVN